jgi:hypothetical protein
MRTYVWIALLIVGLGCGTGTGYAASSNDPEIAALKAKVQALEERLAALETIVLGNKPATASKANDDLASLQKRAQNRMQMDAKKYTTTQLQEIEKLYQVANKQYGTPAAKESLQTLVTTYKNANRTGCAVLYLAQMSKGKEKETYLLQAIEDFSDCWYGDGVQVGPYARFQLGLHYMETNKKDDAKKMFDRLKLSYPTSLDHQGKKLIDLIP